MNWLIERVHRENGDEQLIEAARHAGHTVTLLEPGRDPKPQSEPSIFHGSIQAAVELQKNPGNVRVWLDEVAFRCTSYFPLVGSRLFNSVYAIMQVSELTRLKWEVYRWFAKDTKIFVRPNSGLKTFTGQLLDLLEFDHFWSNPTTCAAQASDLVFISSPQEIQGEWRFVVDETGEIIAQTTYQYQGNRTYIPGAPGGASALCREVLKDGLNLGPMFTVDIAQSPSGRFGVLEANAFSTAALYACKMEPIVRRAEALLG